MPPNEENSKHLCDLPPEILLYIFSFLTGKQLIRCRQVCERWKLVIDGLARSDVLWREHCKSDFSSICKIAKAKSRIGVRWFHIYRSLSLWPRLAYARETRDEFAFASRLSDEIEDIEVLKDGILAVHKLSSIVYYNIETLEPAKRGPISGGYMRHAENDNSIIIQSFHMQIFIVKKMVYFQKFEANVTFDDIKLFHLVDNKVYMVSLENDLYVVDLDSPDLQSTLLGHCEESVMTMGYKNQLNILTYDRNIYSLTNTGIIHICHLEDCPNLMHELHRYGLLETMVWSVYQQWMCLWNRNGPYGPLQDILSVHSYGDMFFVGCKYGLLRIYYAPYKDGELNLYSAEPVKQYNFSERSDVPVLTKCPIIKVDVLEAEAGHTVVVAMPKKIAVLDYVHNFKRTASVAMLLYADVQKVKMLKIDDAASFRPSSQ